MEVVIVTVTKVADTEVEVDQARLELIHKYSLDPNEVTGLTAEEVAQMWVSYAEGRDLDLCYDRIITPVTRI